MNNILKIITGLALVGITLLVLVSKILLPMITNKSDNVYLPDVKQINIIKAKKILTDLDFNVDVVYSNYTEKYEPNIVISMSPRAFTKVKKGRHIKIKVAGDKDDILVDDFIDKSLRNTKIILDRKNLLIDTLIYEYSNNIAKNNIIEQYPKANKILKSFDKVTFIVSLGSPPDYYIVPNLINTNLKTAKNIISKSGLTLGSIKYEFDSNYLNNTIVEQSLTDGMKLSFPHKIDLIVTTDRINNE